MTQFTFADFKRGVKPYIDEKVTLLKKPVNSEFYYLTELGEGDVAFECECIKAYCPSIQYKVVGHYNSTLKQKEPQKSTTYSSSTALNRVDGFLLERSTGHADIPAALSQKLGYVGWKVATDSVEELIKRDALTKIRNKVRRAGEHIETEDIYGIEITEIGGHNEEKEEILDSLLWARIIRKSDGKLIGYAHKFHNKDAEFTFLPDESKAGLDHSVKPVKAPKPEKKAPTKKDKPQMDTAERVGYFIGQVLIGLVLAAAVLLVEFAVIFIANKGAIDKLHPGMYVINEENYNDFFVFVYSSGQEFEKAEARKQIKNPPVFGSDGSDGDVELFWISPRTTQFRIFDMGEKSALSISEDDVSKYIITDLCIQLEVTYSYNGEVHTEKIEKIVPIVGNNTESVISVSIPVEAVEENTFMGSGTGSYHADLDYWLIEVVKVSGVAEVKEVEK